MTKEKKLKTELMEFTINLDMLNGVKRKVEFKHKLDKQKIADHPELKDVKFHKAMQDMIISLAEKQENLLSGDKVVKLAEKSVSRLKVLSDVYKLNNLEDLRKILMKELNPSQFKDKKKEDGTFLFSKAKLASMTSLNSRFTKYATLLFAHKDMFKVKDDDKKVRRIFAKHNAIHPNIFTFDGAGKRTASLNNNTDLVIVTTNELDKLYNVLIKGEEEPIKLPDSVDDLSSKKKNKDKPKGSSDNTSDDLSNGATLKTIAENNNFDILNRYINLAITKDPQKFVKEILDKDFANIKGDTKDPLIELLKPSVASTAINFIREVIIYASSRHSAMTDENSQKKIKEIINVSSGVSFNTEKKEYIRLD